jgi:hypothetical protein
MAQTIAAIWVSLRIQRGAQQSLLVQVKNELSFEEGGWPLHRLLRPSLKPSYRSSGIQRFSLLVYRYIIHPKLRPPLTMGLSHQRLLVTSFLVAVLVASEYRRGPFTSLTQLRLQLFFTSFVVGRSLVQTASYS